MDHGRVPQLVRSSSTAAYKKRNSTGIGLQKHQQQADTYHVTNYQDKSNHAEQYKMILERVIGLTTSSGAQIALDQTTGTIAYPAGCVAVLLGKNIQDNIINTSKKTITALAFSSDGKYLAIGESGHSPSVRVYEVQSKLQVMELSGHKFGITCVAFSPNNKYLVSVGTHHDMVTNVWNWKHGIKVACNKISSKVNGCTFSADGNMFITIGVRHVKYWFLDESKRKSTIQNKNETVPLLGRNGLLGDQKTNTFVDVAHGKGSMSDSIYVLSQNGMLCLLTDRQICKTVELKTIRAYCLTSSESLILVGCANGIIRLFDAATLQYVQTLHKPHPLGISVVSNTLDVPWDGTSYRYPDAIGLVLNEYDMTLSVVYSDRSLYRWDLSRLPQVGKISSFLYHSSCIWDVNIYPDNNLLPAGSFITSSSDDTIRLWNLSRTSYTQLHQKKSSFNSELLSIIYTDPSLGSICEQEYNADKADIYESRNGVRCVITSPTGHHIASGDLVGNIRIYDILTMSQLHNIEAHDSGILCLEYSDFSNDIRYLVSASRDRLIHVFDAANEYQHLQTLSDHSSSVASVKLLHYPDYTLMISCANDKSLLFREATAESEHSFVLRQNLHSKTTPHDIIVDKTRHVLATACQDRMIRLYNASTAKAKRHYKGSHSDDGYLMKLALDQTGTLLAASCSDKSISILDFYTGEIVATLVGHSEVVTSLKFTNNCRHLISVAADGCMFLWRLDDNLIQRIRDSSLKRTNSERMLSTSKPDVTMVNFDPGYTADDFDEKTFVVNHPKLISTELPSWTTRNRSDSPATRGKWDKNDRATPVMTKLKNGEIHMSPESASLANRSAHVIQIATEEPITTHHGHPGADDTDEEEMEELLPPDEQLGMTNGKQRQLPNTLSLNNNELSYNSIAGDGELILYREPSMDESDDADFTVTHRSYNKSQQEDEDKSTGSESINAIESGDDGLHTPRSSLVSTPTSSVPSTPLSPQNHSNTHILDLMHLQQDYPAGAHSDKSSTGSGRKETIRRNMNQSSAASKQSRQSPNSKDTSRSSNHRVSSMESLTSTGQSSSYGEELGGAGLHDETTPTAHPNVSFSEIDQLCTALKNNLVAAQKIYKQIEHKNNSDKDYFIETLRDVCDSIHTMLPPTSQFEAIVHQTVHQFLLMNRDQGILDKAEVKSFQKST